ncbi:hypothetical protein RvY_04670 [Ramazzottius varieornatus]|uniref:Uncharacterized protein n=1 Tax=Ramazzottius varieornatus TaxID=947166 RepID=A0A1D1USF9_RAMVA|nr:hypothetical protein RvY_04670 [Ramazzottius varieornatus]
MSMIGLNIPHGQQRQRQRTSPAKHDIHYSVLTTSARTPACSAHQAKSGTSASQDDKTEGRKSHDKAVQSTQVYNLQTRSIDLISCATCTRKEMQTAASKLVSNPHAVLRLNHANRPAFLVP